MTLFSQPGGLTAVSLRLGHTAALTRPRHVIHCRGAASLPQGGSPVKRKKPGAEHIRAGFFLSKTHSMGLPYIASNSVQSASAAFGTSIPTSQPAMSSVPTSGSFILSA